MHHYGTEVGSMAKPTLPPLTSSIICALLFFSPSAFAESSPPPISDVEISSKKNNCYADIESGLWGERCRSSMIDKENCALQCVSPVCYELIYESDPLEEGERDYIRSQEYKYCIRRLSVGLSLDGVKGTFDDVDLHVKPPSMSFPGSVRVGTFRRK